ncbi:MAG: hypothetical protein QW757_03630 [Candidatus Woesearchaeota archaeon]
MPNEGYLTEQLEGDLGKFLNSLTSNNLLLIALYLEYYKKIRCIPPSFQRIIQNTSFYIPHLSEISSSLGDRKPMTIENETEHLYKLIQTAETGGYNLIILNPLPVIVSPKRDIKLEGLYSQIAFTSLRDLVDKIKRLEISREYPPYFFEKK